MLCKGVVGLRREYRARSDGDGLDIVVGGRSVRGGDGDGAELLRGVHEALAELADGGLGGDKLLPALGGHAERPRRDGLRGVDGHRGQRRGTTGDLVPGRAREPAAGNGDSRRARRRTYAEARRRMKRLVSDELWEPVEPLLPPEPDKPKGGRPRDRKSVV